MNTTYQSFTLLAAILLLMACSVKEPPKDSNGKTPQQVIMDTYLLTLVSGC